MEDKNKAFLDQVKKEYEETFGLDLTYGIMAQFIEQLINRRRGQFVVDLIDKKFASVKDLMELQESAESVNKEFWKHEYTKQFRASIAAGDLDHARVIANGHLVKYLNDDERLDAAKEMGKEYTVYEGMILTRKEVEIISNAQQSSKV